MKKKLFDNEDDNKKRKENSRIDNSFNQEAENTPRKHDDKFQLSKSEGLIGSISTLRNGINKEVF